MHQKKRLILFFDGTWDDAIENTNVYRLSSLLHDYDGDIHQRFFYNPGVGTRPFEKIIGGLIGLGLSKNLLDGYEWLIKRYCEEDEIWIFGFSRGAYTARSLAGLIRKCGLLHTSTKRLLHEAEKLYRNKEISPEDTIAKTFRHKYSREVNIHFLGIWDTVGVLGIPSTNRTNRHRLTWHDTELSKIVQRAYHAMALDENREAYDVTLWTFPTGNKKPEQIEVEQRWFIGSHANVGGGYEADPLSDITLEWMINKAKAAGLKVSDFHAENEAWKKLPIDSYQLFLHHTYALLKDLLNHGNGRFYRKYDTDFKNDLAVNITIDESVYKLYRHNNKYRPETLDNVIKRLKRYN